MKPLQKTLSIIGLVALIVILFFVLQRSVNQDQSEVAISEQYPAETSCELIRKTTAPGGLYIVKHERCRLTEVMARTYINFDELGDGALPQEYYPMTLMTAEDEVLFEWGIEVPTSGFPLSVKQGGENGRWDFVFLDPETLLLEKRSQQDIRTVTLSEMTIPSLEVTELFTHQFDVPVFGFSGLEETRDSFIFSPQTPNSVSTDQKLSLDKQTREITVVSEEE